MKQITALRIQYAKQLDGIIKNAGAPGNLKPIYNNPDTLQQWAKGFYNDYLNLCTDNDTRKDFTTWTPGPTADNLDIIISNVIILEALEPEPDYTKFDVFTDPEKAISSLLQRDTQSADTLKRVRKEYINAAFAAGELTADDVATEPTGNTANNKGTGMTQCGQSGKLPGSLEPSDYTDVGQANVFTSVYGDIVKYTPATKFIIYDGTVWKESEIKAQGLSQELTERQLKEARTRVSKAQKALNKAVENNDPDKITEAKKQLKQEETFRGYVLERRKVNKVLATLTAARPKTEIDITQLDADGYLLNTPGGTVDLRTGKMNPHKSEDYCTKITTVTPDTVNAALFADFMKRVTVGDKDLERYLQEVAGMCAIGHVLRENLIIAYGEGGNGKSTLFNLLSHVLGDYAGALSAETLTANCRKNKSPEYAELRGKRLIIAAELEEGMRLDTAIIKKLCSTDPILAEKKFKDPFVFLPSHTIILYTNHLPKIGTNDKGTWDRIIAVPFLANFRGMKGEIKNYADHLYKECGGAVLSWIIEGAKRFIDNNYEIILPDCVKQAIDKYRASNDWFGNFLTECCDINPIYKQPSGALYQRYKDYCNDNGLWCRSAPDFKQFLDAAGFETKRAKQGMIVCGLSLKP